MEVRRLRVMEAGTNMGNGSADAPEIAAGEDRLQMEEAVTPAMPGAEVLLAPLFYGLGDEHQGPPLRALQRGSPSCAVGQGEDPSREMRVHLDQEFVEGAARQSRELGGSLMDAPLSSEAAVTNPFWSPEVRRSAMVDQVIPESGLARPLGLPEVVPDVESNSMAVISPDQAVERLRLKVLRDAEEVFLSEVRRMKGAEDGGSYHSASSGEARRMGLVAEQKRTSAGQAGGALPAEVRHGNLPKGDYASHVEFLEPLEVGFKDHLLRMCLKGLDTFAASWIGGNPYDSDVEARKNWSQPVPDILKVGELPSLPVLGSEGASIQFGDWLVLARPVMNDIGGSASAWWGDVLTEVDSLYGQWLMASPLERLRLKPPQRALDAAGQRIELKAVPEGIKKDVVAARTLTSTSILSRLYTLYQPGGGAERAGLLKSISDPKVPSNVHEMVSSLRQWRKCVSRAEELQVTPDASILMLVMSKFADALGKSGGVQVTYRIAGARQELKVDYRPEHYTIKELAEYLQAKAEELSLAAGSKPSPLAATTAGGGGPVVKAMNVGSGAGAQDGDRSATKPACKFWRSEDGCRKGQDCSYGHDTADMKGRCFGCGATSHVKKECPIRKLGDGNGGFGKVWEALEEVRDPSQLVCLRCPPRILLQI